MHGKHIVHKKQRCKPNFWLATRFVDIFSTIIYEQYIGIMFSGLWKSQKEALSWSSYKVSRHRNPHWNDKNPQCCKQLLTLNTSGSIKSISWFSSYGKTQKGDLLFLKLLKLKTKNKYSDKYSAYWSDHLWRIFSFSYSLMHVRRFQRGLLPPASPLSPCSFDSK